MYTQKSEFWYWNNQFPTIQPVISDNIRNILGSLGEEKNRNRKQQQTDKNNRHRLTGLILGDAGPPGFSTDFLEHPGY